MIGETLKASCTDCGKEVFSLYKNRLEYNLDAHERKCLQKQIDTKMKGDRNQLKQTGDDSS